MTNRVPVYDRLWRVVGYTTSTGFNKARTLIHDGGSVKFERGPQGYGWVSTLARYADNPVHTTPQGV